MLPHSGTQRVRAEENFHFNAQRRTVQFMRPPLEPHCSTFAARNPEPALQIDPRLWMTKRRTN